MPRGLTRFLIYMLITAIILTLGTPLGFAEEKPEVKESKPQEPALKHIFIITINGLGKEGFNQTYTPNTNGLAASGIKTNEALTVLPSTTPAVVASILTGAEPPTHGFYKKGDSPKVGNILKVFDNYGRKVAFVDGSGELKGLVSDKHYRSAKSDFDSHGDKGVMDQAIKEFKAEQPYFMNIVLPGVEKTGHQYGDKSQHYRQAISKADEQIGRLLQTLQNFRVLDNALIVVTGDHGFTGKDHGRGEGAFSEREMVVPAVIKGPGIKQGMIIPPFRLVDIAPTITYAAGINSLEGATGLVIWNSLKNGRGYNQYSLLEKRISDLSNLLNDNYREKFILEERKRLVDEEKASIIKEKSRTQEIVNSKDNQINRLEWQIRLMKLAGLVLAALMGFGYIVEYLYLRKKFLMF